MKVKSVFTALLFLAFGMSAYGVQVSAPELSADPGSAIIVEISVDDATGIAGGDILLEYDSTILEVKGNPRTTALSGGLSLVANIAVAGRISIAMAGATGLAGGSGAIVEIDFDVKADASGVSPLTLSDVALFDEIGMDIDVTVMNGSVTVQLGQPSQPRTLSIADATGDAGTVIATTMEIDDLSGVAGADIIVLYDSLMLSVETVTPTALLAGLSAIVNKDVPGRIAISIAGSTGIEAGTGAIFDVSFKAKDDASGETDVTFESADLYDEIAENISVGATLGGKITIIAAAVQPRMLTIADATGNAGEVIATTVEIDDVSGVAGGDIALLYDSTVLSAENVSAAALLTGLSIIVNTDTPGRIVISIAGATGAGAGSGAILNVSLKAKDDASGETELTFESAELYDENAGSIPVETGAGGKITIIAAPVQPKMLTIADATGKAGTIIATTVQIDDLTGVAGADIALLYDSALLSVEEVKTTDLLAGMSAIVNTDTAGKIVVSIASTTGAEAGSGAILDLSFKAKEDLTEDVETALTFESAELYDENAASIPVETADGKIKIEKRGDFAVREHTHGDPMLALEATYNQANTHGHTYIDIWQGGIAVETGMFLEFQAAMFSGNPTFKGTVDLHTSDGTTLRDSGTKDQNDLSAHPNTDLSEYARDKWYHRKISLDALAGKTIDGIMIATDSDQHGADVFRIYVDNIQITDGVYILEFIWGDEATQETIPITGTTVATGTTFAGTEGMSDYSVTIVGATPVTPGGKLISTWGSIKKAR